MCPTYGVFPISVFRACVCVQRQAYRMPWRLEYGRSANKHSHTQRQKSCARRINDCTKCEATHTHTHSLIEGKLSWKIASNNNEYMNSYEGNSVVRNSVQQKSNGHKKSKKNDFDSFCALRQFAWKPKFSASRSFPLTQRFIGLVFCFIPSNWQCV